MSQLSGVCTQEPQTATGTCPSQVLTLKFDFYLTLPGTERSGGLFSIDEALGSMRVSGGQETLFFSSTSVMLGSPLTVQSLGLPLCKRVIIKDLGSQSDHED